MCSGKCFQAQMMPRRLGTQVLQSHVCTEQCLAMGSPCKQHDGDDGDVPSPALIAQPVQIQGWQLPCPPAQPAEAAGDVLFSPVCLLR